MNTASYQDIETAKTDEDTESALISKTQPAMQETWVQSLGREDPPGEGHGNPLQYSCLENPRDGKSGGLPSMGSHRVRHN